MSDLRSKTDFGEEKILMKKKRTGQIEISSSTLVVVYIIGHVMLCLVFIVSSSPSLNFLYDDVN